MTGVEAGDAGMEDKEARDGIEEIQEDMTGREEVLDVEEERTARVDIVTCGELVKLTIDCRTLLSDVLKKKHTKKSIF